jgi:MYXO-CTERM domain-containing protein
MRKIMMAAMVASLAGVAGADVFNDNSGNHLGGGDLHDFFASQSFNHLDIVSVGVTNDATNLYFDITLNADLDATAWGKYAVGINTGNGSTDAGNGWGRNISWNGQEISHWIATWADDGGSGIGGQVWSYSGGWNLTGGLSGADASQHAAGRQIFSVALADLGLSVGDVILFDVVSTGGGNDPGVDHLSNSAFATDDWGVTSTAGQFLAYTIAPIPTPGALALLGLGGLVTSRRRR